MVLDLLSVGPQQVDVALFGGVVSKAREDANGDDAEEAVGDCERPGMVVV